MSVFNKKNTEPYMNPYERMKDRDKTVQLMNKYGMTRLEGDVEIATTIVELVERLVATMERVELLTEMVVNINDRLA